MISKEEIVRKPVVISLENFTNDYIAYLEFLSQYPTGCVPEVKKVLMGKNSQAFVTIILSDNEAKDLVKYLKDNR